MAGYWRLGMMKMVFYRCQAIHISCRLQTAKNIAVWPYLMIIPTVAFKSGLMLKILVKDLKWKWHYTEDYSQSKVPKESHHRVHHLCCSWCWLLARCLPLRQGVTPDIFPSSSMIHQSDFSGVFGSKHPPVPVHCDKMIITADWTDKLLLLWWYCQSGSELRASCKTCAMCGHRV